MRSYLRVYHPNLGSLLYGNRKILQFHIELGTNKS